MKKVLALSIIAIIIFTLFLTGCANAEIPVKVTETSILEIETTNAIVSENEAASETSQETTVAATPEIVFYSSNSSISNIYICNPDGSNLTKLIEGGIYTSPSWNKEHTKIVLTSINAESGVSNFSIYDMQSKNKTLLLERFSPRDPSFSPEGNTIVFADFAEDGNENSEIYTIGTDGSNLTKLTDNPAKDYFPKYSPDGKTIVFSSERDGNIQLYTMDRDGKNVKRLMENEFTDNSPNFSPDGLNIIFNSNRGGNSDIYSIGSDGNGEPNNLTNNSAGNYDACYSPDGTMIVYRSNMGLDDSMSYDIFVMSAVGSNQINITPDLSDTDEFNPSW